MYRWSMLVANNDVLDAGSLGVGADEAVSAYELPYRRRLVMKRSGMQAKFELSPSFAVIDGRGLVCVWSWRTG